MAAPQESCKSDIRPLDIILGKGRYCTDHIGSIAYKAMLEARLPHYMNPKAESCDKTSMTVVMIETIMKEGGRFMREKKKGSGVLVELTKAAAREKVRDGFRDAVKRARKQKSTNNGVSFLSRIGFALQVTISTSFAEIVSQISRDPVMQQFFNKSQERQEEMQRRKQRRFHKIARRTSLQVAPSSFFGKEDTDGGLFRRLQHDGCCVYAPVYSSSDRNSLVPTTPAQLRPVQLPLLRQEGTPRHPCMNSGFDSDPSQIFQQPMHQTISAASPTRMLNSCSQDTSLSIPLSDPWNEGDLDEEADPIAANDLLELLEPEPADNIVEALGFPFRNEDEVAPNDDSDDDDWLENLEALIDAYLPELGKTEAIQKETENAQMCRSVDYTLIGEIESDLLF